MSTLKTHNLHSPDAGSVNIALTANAGMIVTGISTFNDRINVGSLGVTTNFTVAGLSTFSDNVIIAEQKELRLEPSGAFKLYRGAGGGGAAQRQCARGGAALCDTRVCAGWRRCCWCVCFHAA